MSANNLAIVGISGRMGQELQALAPEFDLKVTTGVASRAQTSGSIEIVSDTVKLDPKKIDIVIDFSLPEATDAVVSWCVREKKPLVSGVTGISEAQKQSFANAGKSIPVLWAPNMSLGVAVMARLFRELAHLEGFEFQIEELHHKRKKDKPSGTALFLQERLKESVGGELPEPLAIRGGGIFGIHRVWAMGEEETLTIEHNAMNRRVFARGALKAATWLLSKPVGHYKMDDVLGSKWQ